ncbi:MAG: hypothetical protein ACTSRZ_17595 [Promethearchaeota archaeon]
MTITMVSANSENDMFCPKCGSRMRIRKIWFKLKSKTIIQCEVCRYHIKYKHDPVDVGLQQKDKDKSTNIIVE